MKPEAGGARAEVHVRMNSFSYVWVAADESAMEELSGEYEAGRSGDQLVELLKPRFAGGKIKNVDSLRAEYGDKVDQQMAHLTLAAAEGIVEVRHQLATHRTIRPFPLPPAAKLRTAHTGQVFALVKPSKTTVPLHYCGTYLYFDEMGSLKDLQVPLPLLQEA